MNALTLPNQECCRWFDKTHISYLYGTPGDRVMHRAEDPVEADITYGCCAHCGTVLSTKIPEHLFTCRRGR